MQNWQTTYLGLKEQMEAVVKRWANRRQLTEADIMAKIAPTRAQRDQFTSRLPLPGGEICRRFDAVAGTVDNCSGGLKSITV